ncbi:hypothetical protein [Roseovarius indicus]|uniref:hypothetical protein n=1 Tax=Roseovarius indicus TaxID=540747 RepID=UPI0007D9B0C6|nr:hypothetical protein A8B76_05585 [Roseovarius indicus]
MNRISALFELRCILRDMERDIGLQELSATEMDVFLAAHAVAEGGDRENPVTSDQIRQHQLVSNLAQATYHRALRSLLKLGLLEKAQGYKSRMYVVRSDIADP